MGLVQKIMELREKTGAGIDACKQAVLASNEDEAKAIDWLRQRGHSFAAGRSGRMATEGVVGSYIHMGGRIGVLVEVNCETDFAAKNERFQRLVKDLGMQIASMNPQYVRREEIPIPTLKSEEAIAIGSMLGFELKPALIQEKILGGRMNKWFGEVCLVDQVWFKDPNGKSTVADEIAAVSGVIGEKISVRRFTRYVCGEGLSKQRSDLWTDVQVALSKPLPEVYIKSK